MNYYTLKGCNANNFFKINLHPDRYYDWDDVKKRAELRIDEERDDKVKNDIEGNICNFQEIIDGRRRREKIIRELFKKKNIKFIENSYVTRNHIMYNRKTSNEVVRIMYRMKILFEHCDIINKWEENKVEEEKQFYTFEEKDNFYEKIYNEFVEENPRFKL